MLKYISHSQKNNPGSFQKRATKCCINQGEFFFTNKLIKKKTQMQLPGQQFCLPNILRKKASTSQLSSRCLGSCQKSHYIMQFDILCNRPTTFQLRCPYSDIQSKYLKDYPGKRTIHNSCTDTCSATKTAMLLHFNSAHVQRRRSTTSS